MLAALHIVDLAIIHEVEIHFRPGLNVLTGETGAGKSIIVGAAGLLRGGRMSTEMIRSGCREAVVEAVFELGRRSAAQRLLERAGLAGGSAREGTLLVRRVLSRSGRGRVYLNGNLSTLALLADLVRSLLDISGQHEHQLLSDRATHRRILDAVGVPAPTLKAVREAHEALARLATDLGRTRLDDRQQAERIDFLRYQLQELEAAALETGEDAVLEEERRRLQHAAELGEASQVAEQALYSGEDAISGRLARLQRQLAGLAPVERRLATIVGQLEEARVLVEDAAQSLRQLAAGSGGDPTRLPQVEERLDLLYRLKRKHGPTLEAALARGASMQEELAELESLEQRTAALEVELTALRQRAEQEAGALSLARQEAGRELAAQVSRQLGQLRMKGARFEVALAPRPVREKDDPALGFAGRRLGPTGWDRVEFLVSANPGEALRPLSRVASGGELSRIMLALRRVLGRHDPVHTSIYDEVDAGIGGAVADVVGRSLAEVARHRQVICVTHLPQVAAHADTHFHVGKGRAQGRARTMVHRLESEARLEELARMLGGEVITDEARGNARELLRAGRRRQGPRAGV